jgi:hypothetical protein
MSRNEEFHQAYRMQHQPSSEGAGLHEAESAFPDFYSMPHVYADSHDKAMDAESTRAIMVAQNKPDAMVRVHRAVPEGVTDINPGDWVTTSKRYARMHGMHPTDPKKDMPVISASVPARELKSGGDSIHEWGWFPNGT